VAGLAHDGDVHRGRQDGAFDNGHGDEREESREDYQEIGGLS
jgi:hypothetical protein